MKIRAVRPLNPSLRKLYETVLLLPLWIRRYRSHVPLFSILYIPTGGIIQGNKTTLQIHSRHRNSTVRKFRKIALERAMESSQAQAGSFIETQTQTTLGDTLLQAINTAF